MHVRRCVGIVENPVERVVRKTDVGGRSFAGSLRIEIGVRADCRVGEDYGRVGGFVAQSSKEGRIDVCRARSPVGAGGSRDVETTPSDLLIESSVVAEDDRAVSEHLRERAAAAEAAEVGYGRQQAIGQIERGAGV